jgi:hypothetical protein
MGVAADTTVRLYELVLENGCSASPYVWRIRYALAHKGLSFESIPIGFTEIPRSLRWAIQNRSGHLPRPHDARRELGHR